jgi:hypothetical protein
VATIKTGNVNALPPIHVWRKQTGNVPILVAGRNRLEAHKRAGCETVLARAIYGDTPEIACAVEAIEIEENLHRRELSPALRKTYTTRLKALHEQEHPKSKGGRPSKTVPKVGKVSKPERFTKAHAKRTGRSEAAVQQDVAEATALGDDVMKKIVGTSLDTPSEITALAAMDEQERAQIIERAVAGETVSAVKPERMSEPKTTPSFGMFAYKLACGLAAVPTPVLQNKLNQVVQCRADLPAKERRFLTDALRAVAKRFEQIADKIDNPGNAGGPLLDSAGRLIGASAGIGVAIPVDVVKGQLIRDGRVPVPGIGIVAASEDEAIRLSIDGIIILRTFPQSAAAKAGLEGAESDGGAVQDVITAANGQPVHSVSDLINILEDVGIGNTVKLTVARDGRSRSLDVPVTDISGQTQG